MYDYETLTVLHPDLGEAGSKELVQKVRGILEAGYSFEAIGERRPGSATAPLHGVQRPLGADPGGGHAETEA